MQLKPNYKPPFSKFVKKAHRPLQLTIEDVIEGICAAPEIGEAKSGDLIGIRVCKFRFNHQEYLVAYRPPSPEYIDKEFDLEFLFIDFYQVGSHENFYEALKRYLRLEE